MKGFRLIQSRFRGVYLGLGVIWVGASLGWALLIDSVIVPRIQASRVQEVESLVQSHRDALQFYDHRPLRDELLRRSIIVQDQDFNEWRPARSDELLAIQKSLSSCQFITSHSCLGPDQIVVFSGPASQSPANASFAIHLTTRFFTQLTGVTGWKVMGSLSLAAILSLIIWAIRKQELFLTQRMRLLGSNLNQITSLFETKPEVGTQTSLWDEFQWISQGLKQAGESLKQKTDQIEEYKRRFEKKTRLEQLAQTIAYTSHDLKAPLQEGADFLRDLPELIETLPREKLLKSIQSLEQRLTSGAQSLQQALDKTRETQLAPERVSLTTVLNQFRNRVQSHPSLGPRQVLFNLEPSSDAAEIFCQTEEMESALWNLTRNSIEAKRNCAISIRGAKEGNDAVIQFSDNGPGIPDPLLDQIFEEFFTTKSRGHGLGLAMVKKTVERNQGTTKTHRIRNPLALNSSNSEEFPPKRRISRHFGGFSRPRSRDFNTLRLARPLR